MPLPVRRFNQSQRSSGLHRNALQNRRPTPVPSSTASAATNIAIPQVSAELNPAEQDGASANTALSINAVSRGNVATTESTLRFPGQMSTEALHDPDNSEIVSAQIPSQYAVGSEFHRRWMPRNPFGESIGNSSDRSSRSNGEVETDGQVLLRLRMRELFESLGARSSGEESGLLTPSSGDGSMDSYGSSLDTGNSQQENVGPVLLTPLQRMQIIAQQHEELQNQLGQMRQLGILLNTLVNAQNSGVQAGQLYGSTPSMGDESSAQGTESMVSVFDSQNMTAEEAAARFGTGGAIAIRTPTHVFFSTNRGLWSTSNPGSASSVGTTGSRNSGPVRVTIENPTAQSTTTFAPPSSNGFGPASRLRNLVQEETAALQAQQQQQQQQQQQPQRPPVRQERSNDEPTARGDAIASREQASIAPPVAPTDASEQVTPITSFRLTATTGTTSAAASFQAFSSQAPRLPALEARARNLRSVTLQGPPRSSPPVLEVAPIDSPVNFIVSAIRGAPRLPTLDRNSAANLLWPEQPRNAGDASSSGSSTTPAARQGATQSTSRVTTTTASAAPTSTAADSGTTTGSSPREENMQVPPNSTAVTAFVATQAQRQVAMRNQLQRQGLQQRDASPLFAVANIGREITQSPMELIENLQAAAQAGNMPGNAAALNAAAAAAADRLGLNQQNRRTKPVCLLYCKFCGTPVCYRGMMAILLADSGVELFSTDTPPPTIGFLQKDYLTEKCKCRIRDVGCLLCGNLIGYHVMQPCKSCLAACNNGHFWMFHKDYVIYMERKSSSSKLVYWPDLPTPDKDYECPNERSTHTISR